MVYGSISPIAYIFWRLFIWDAYIPPLRFINNPHPPTCVSSRFWRSLGPFPTYRRSHPRSALSYYTTNDNSLHVSKSFLAFSFPFLRRSRVGFWITWKDKYGHFPRTCSTQWTLFFLSQTHIHIHTYITPMAYVNAFAPLFTSFLLLPYLCFCSNSFHSSRPNFLLDSFDYHVPVIGTTLVGITHLRTLALLIL